jgi:hypothetical protein
MFTKKCNAIARTNKNQVCHQPAMANGKCRLHGGKSTGPKTIEGRRRIAQAQFKHGYWSNSAIAERKALQKYIKLTLSQLSR